MKELCWAKCIRLMPSAFFRMSASSCRMSPVSISVSLKYTFTSSAIRKLSCTMGGMMSARVPPVTPSTSVNATRMLSTRLRRRSLYCRKCTSG